MELNEALLWLVGTSCVMTIVTALRGGARDLAGWLAVSILVLAIGGVSWWAARDHAGFIAGAAWAMLIVTPGLGMRRVRRYAGRMDPQRAMRLASVLRWLHPLDGWWTLPVLFRAQWLDDRGDPDAAHALLAPLAQRPDAVGRQAAHHLLRAARRWVELIAWVERLEPDAVARDPGLIASYVRALGETGQFMRMLWAFNFHRSTLDAPANGPARAGARLAVLALTGQFTPVETLLAGAMRETPAPVKAYWLATAEMAAGDVDRGRERLHAAMPAASVAVRDAMQQRFDAPPADARPFVAGGGAPWLARVDAEREQEERYGLLAGPAKRPVATYLLLLANVLVYVLETLRGGGTNIVTLYRLGAADYFSVILGHQYWRLLACTFLHFGWLHLSMNMLGLLVLGPFVERTAGRILYVFTYVLCGVAGAAGVVWLSARHPDEQTLLVGASASIMGLVGATAAVLLAGLLRERARVAAQRLRAVMFIVVVQVVFDHFTPRVSGAAHLFGLACGFVVLMPLRLLSRESTPVPSPPGTPGGEG